MSAGVWCFLGFHKWELQKVGLLYPCEVNKCAKCGLKKSKAYLTHWPIFDMKEMTKAMSNESLEAVAPLLQSPAVVTDEDRICVVAHALAEADGCDPNELIWEGNPPEPWGEVWNKYESQARAALEAVAPLLQSPAVDHAAMVAEINERCQRVMRAHGKVYPRTCYTCGLRGPCVVSDAALTKLAAAPTPGESHE